MINKRTRQALAYTMSKAKPEGNKGRADDNDILIYPTPDGYVRTMTWGELREAIDKKVDEAVKQALEEAGIER